jgi:transcriptional regulator with XRE-family HTH domain
MTRDIEQQLRDAITASGRSLNQLSQESGVNDSQLSRFLRGRRSLTMATAGALCKVLGLQLCPVEDKPAAESPAKKRKKK